MNNAPQIPLHRAYLFAKIHGIFASFNSTENLLQLLQQGNGEPAAARFSGAGQYNSALPVDRLELNLHREALHLLGRLLPAHASIRDFFKTLVSEYEIRNISAWFKQERRHNYLIPGSLANLPRNLFAEAVNSGEPDELNDRITRELLNSPYAGPVEAFLNDGNSEQLDSNLQSLYNSRLHCTARLLPHRDRNAVLPLLDTLFAIQNSIAMLRRVHLYDADPRQALQQLYSSDKRQRRQLLELAQRRDFPDAASCFLPGLRPFILSALERNSNLLPPDFEPDMSSASLAALNNVGRSALGNIFERNFYKKQQTIGPLFCFYFLLKDEILRIILLHHSIRFQLDPETFRKELVH